MSEERSDSLRRERAVLFGGVLPEDLPPYEGPLDELARLADTAGALPVSSVVQKIRRINPTYYVGPGTAERLATEALRTDAEVLISDNNLSPGQLKNLEKVTGHRVVDRTELILDIFACHARTREAKLQVELAQLEYMLPRLKRLWTHLERMVGGAGASGRIGTRGPGEKELETDRRLIRKKIQELRRVLQEIQERKNREVRARRGEFTVSLVGYTNAGKSTLLVALTGARQKIEDQLFSTLDTKTRVAPLLGDGRRALVSDTVGFIRKLPPHLVASFHATLEEVLEAHLILHVVDVSHADPGAQIEAVEEILGQIGADAKPVLMVFNKIDLVRDPVELDYWRRRYPSSVAISAARGDGLDDLRRILADRVSDRWIETEVRFDIADSGRVRAFLCERGQILGEHYEDHEGQIRARFPPRDLGRLAEIGGRVERDRVAPQP